jgi:hypothetical protein
VALATGAAATTNPYSTLLSGVASNPAFSNLVGSTFGAKTPAEVAALDFSKYGTGDAGFQKMIDDIYGR